MSINIYEKWAGPAPGYTLDDYRYGDKGPWPKVNTLVKELPPVIENVPQEQLDDFRINVVTHYRRVLKSGRVKIFLKCWQEITVSVQPMIMYSPIIFFLA